MKLNNPGRKLQMLYKLTTYALIAFGGTISGALIGSVTGPINIRLSLDETGTLGACIGAFLAFAGCKFAIEHQEAAEQDRGLLLALEGRLVRLLNSSKPNSTDG